MLALLAAAVIDFQTVQITPDTFALAKEPQIAVTNESVYFAYGRANAIYFSRSDFDGKNVSVPVKVGELAKLALGMRRGPRIALCGNTIIITAVSHETGDLNAFRSNDGGKTWAGPIRINDVEGVAREGLHAMASYKNTATCVWLDLRLRGTRLFAATSSDAGQTWSENFLVYESPGGSICECCHPSIAMDKNGRAYFMFRNSISGARDMFLISPKANGQAQGAAKLGVGTWKINACPMDGGAFVVTENNEIASVWRRENSIYSCGTNGAEILIGEGQQPWMAVSKRKLYYTWANKGAIYAKAPEGNVQVLSRNGNDPVVASSPNGSAVFAAWTENGIKLRRLR